MKKDNYMNLNIGNVKENFVIAKNKDVKLWKSRGFYIVRKYQIFHYKPKLSETVMLGMPQNIKEFGLDSLKKCKIVDVSLQCGTYGMGGPGFAGFKLEGDFGCRWLVYGIWAAGEHILLDNRVLECNAVFKRKYNPWIDPKEQEESLETVKKELANMEIHHVELEDEELKISLVDEMYREHTIQTYRVSEKFPEQGGTGKKRLSFDEGGKMEDYWLVIYDDTNLMV